MKKIILFLIILLVFACGPTYHLTNDFNCYYTQEQVDSVCRVERIPTNLNKWNTMVQIADTIPLNQYIYIKSTDSTHVVWTLTDLDSLYKFKKKTLKITDKK